MTLFFFYLVFDVTKHYSTVIQLLHNNNCLSYFYFLFSIVAVVVRAQSSCHLRELDLCLASGLAGGQSLPSKSYLNKIEKKRLFFMH